MDEFLKFLEQNNLENRLLGKYLFFKPEDKLIEVIQKIIVTSGQLIWVDENMVLKGMLSLQEIFKIFIE